MAFCAWLTDRERKIGRLGAAETYRLPSDHEWSCAVGIGKQEDAAKLPAQKDAMLQDVYPWGGAWPPPEKAGNYAGREVGPLVGKLQIKQLSDYQDGAIKAAPVGSFGPNQHSLYDLGGNLREWCADEYHSGRKLQRGGAWNTDSRDWLLSSRRWPVSANDGWDDCGFRVVLAPAP